VTEPTTSVFHLSEVLVTGETAKSAVSRLRDHSDTVLGYPKFFYQALLRGLRDGHHEVGPTSGSQDLQFPQQRRTPMREYMRWKAFWNDVMHGHDHLDLFGKYVYTEGKKNRSKRPCLTACLIAHMSVIDRRPPAAAACAAGVVVLTRTQLPPIGISSQPAGSKSAIKVYVFWVSCSTSIVRSSRAKRP